MVRDYAPGADAEKSFSERFTAGGGEVRRDDPRAARAIPTSRRSCSASRDAQPDALFVFVPSGQGGTFMKQFVERGLDKAGIKLIGPGDVTDDDQLPRHGRRQRSASSRRTTTRPRIRRPTNKDYRRGLREGQQASARTSWRSAATTACT